MSLGKAKAALTPHMQGVHPGMARCSQKNWPPTHNSILQAAVCEVKLHRLSKVAAHPRLQLQRGHGDHLSGDSLSLTLAFYTTTQLSWRCSIVMQTSSDHTQVGNTVTNVHHDVHDGGTSLPLYDSLQFPPLLPTPLTRAFPGTIAKASGSGPPEEKAREDAVDGQEHAEGPKAPF